MTTSQLQYADTVELSSLIAQRLVSPREVVDECIDRVLATNPGVNAFVFTDFERAIEEANRCGDELARGESRGPLHGVPVALKDLFDFRPGWPATLGGIPALKDHVRDGYCIFAERVESAGGILIGKTNSPVLGFRGTCDNPLFGPTRNPFAPQFNSGGSSGGSAVAVATGMVSLAEGSDAGGSIRIPAAWCGVYGFQPSFGVVPRVVRPNAFANMSPFLYEGPITRSVRDAELALQVLSTGEDDRDPFFTERAIGRPPSGRPLRIGVTPGFGSFPVDRRIVQVLLEAAQVFEGAGHEVRLLEFDLPYDAVELAQLWCRQVMIPGISTLRSLERAGFPLSIDDPSSGLPEQYRSWMKVARSQSVPDLVSDMTMRTEVADALASLFRDVDIVLSATVGSMPVMNASEWGATVGPDEIEGVRVDELIGWCPTLLTNFSGHPSASVPAGMVDGFPVGMQIMGRRFGDADVLQTSALFEALQPWMGTYQQISP